MMDVFLKTGKLGNTSYNEGSTSKSGSSGVKNETSTIPWVEKYRPRTVDELVEQTEVVAVLRQCLKGADLPNLLFYGPPGTGKTSTILAAARQLFGDFYKERILELNASDDRGIAIIRDKVKTFAQLSAGSTRPDGQACPSFKIILLDEADSMTQAAQAALRRTMEIYTKTTRFCLVCNYVSRIIPPITSRCSKFRFKPLGTEKIIQRLENIAQAENVAYEPEALKTLVKSSNGDLRKAITTLQSCARIKNEGETVTEVDVVEIGGIIPESCITELMNVCAENNFSKIENFVNEILFQAYSVSQFLEQLNEHIILDFKLSDKKKATIFEKLSVCSGHLQDGASEYIQLIDLCCSIAKALQGLDNAGKTTILKRFNGEDINLISPTLGFNIKTLEHRGYKLNIWDVGGQKSLRSYWRNYFECTDGLVWVVDSADKRRLDNCKTELHQLLAEERLAGATLLVFCNKQDLPGALSSDAVKDVLELDDIKTHHWNVVHCSAVTGVNLLTGMDWLIDDISARIFTLD